MGLPPSLLLIIIYTAREEIWPLLLRKASDFIFITKNPLLFAFERKFAYSL